MAPPLVSVLMTVYNREKFLAAAIESVLAQSFTDWELIIVDDRSKDSSLEIARRYAKDRRVRVILNEQNLGDYPNRNRAASFAHGKYLKYVDADDVIYPHCLELMVQGMEAFPEAGLGISRALLGVHAPVLLSSADAYRDHYFGSGMFSTGPLDTIIRRSAFEAIGGFHPARSTGDSHCWPTLARYAPVVIIASGLVWYRIHANQESALLRGPDTEMSAGFEARYFRFGVEALEHPQCPLPKEERLIGRTRAIKSFARTILGTLCRGRFGLARILYRQSGQCLFSFLQASLTHTPASPRVVLNPVSPSKPVVLSVPQSPISVSISQPSTPGPLVSVLIPVCNAEAYLAKAIESVLAQRFADWELVIVDDASTDRTAEIAQSCADGNRIRYYRNEHNLGKWNNHNRCAQLARGKYLKFLHADDLLYPHCLMVMSEVMLRYPDAGLGVSGACGPYRAGVCLDSLTALRSEFFGTPRFLEGMTALIIRSEVFRELKVADSVGCPPERLLQLKIANEYPTVLFDTGLVYYRRYSGSAYLGLQKWPYNWAEGYRSLIDWIQSPAVVLDEAEKRIAITNLLRYVWRRGDVYHRRSIKRVSLQERFAVLRLARHLGVKGSELVCGSPAKRGWSSALTDHAMRLVDQPMESRAGKALGPTFAS